MSRYPLFERPTPSRPKTVSELTFELKAVLEDTFPSVWVVGQISNLSSPRSGHCYLTLKDAGAQLPAVIWRSTASRLRFQPRDGIEVVCRGRIDLYPPHGKYQLVIDQMEPKGVGALELAFRQLFEKLSKEGLFDPRLKRPLPPFIQHVAVVTSPTGAAVRDFLQVLNRRWPRMRVMIVPVRVQGEGAAFEIAAAVDQVNRLADPPDCVVLTRGGGSLEDLWAFNEEIVVRAIRRSKLPVVSGVGHEIDVTLSDLAADVRALTPSEAAERVSPDENEVRRHLRHLQLRLAAAMRAKTAAARRHLSQIAGARAFRRPMEWIHDRARRVDDLELRLKNAVLRRLQRDRERLEALEARIESLSPLAVLRRGYSLTLDDSGRILDDARRVSPGQTIETRMAKGRLLSRVEQTLSDKEPATMPSVDPRMAPPTGRSHER